MKNVKVTLVPNIETDRQSFSFDELGVTHFEWTKMSEDDQGMLILENITENICSHVNSIEVI